MATLSISLPRISFEALKSRDFRWFWLGRLASSATFQMSNVVQGWLVYKLTGSAFALGWVSAGWSISTLILSPYGGVIADRMDKRKILMWARIGMALNGFLLGLLISLDLVQIWHLAASSLVTGITFAFMMPAQSAIISDLVDKETLLNANALNAVGMGLMGIFCASLAGLLIDTIGPASVYYTMGVLYVMAMYTVYKLPTTPPKPPTEASVWRDMIDGARYLGKDTALMALMGLGLVRVIFVMPYRTLMPAYAETTLGMGSEGLGLLLSMAGIGSLISALLLCGQTGMKRKGQTLMQAGVIVGFTMILYVAVPWLWGTYLFIILLGAFNNVCMVMNSTLMLTLSDEAYRGRVMAVYMMLWGLTPLGTLPAGAMADVTGVPLVVIIQGVLVIALFGAMLIRRKDLRVLA